MKLLVSPIQCFESSVYNSLENVLSSSKCHHYILIDDSSFFYHDHDLFFASVLLFLLQKENTNSVDSAHQDHKADRSNPKLSPCLSSLAIDCWLAEVMKRGSRLIVS